jgi:hypothetical protein
MNSKAVSPLLATVFLIAVSVSLGTVVMSLGEDYVEQATPKSCSFASYEIKKVSYYPEKDYIDIAVDNGEAQIDSFAIKVFDRSYSQAFSVVINAPLGPHEAKVLRVSLGRRITDVYEVKIVPQTSDDSCSANPKQITADSAIFSKMQ